MKNISLSIALLAVFTPIVVSQSPIERVVVLIGDLRAKIVADGNLEQKSYDKFACWCEDTLQRKASDISSAKESIENLQTLIVKLKGEISAHGVEMKQLEQDITKNIDSQQESAEVRDKERKEYNEEKMETEQCIGALEAAIRVLSGAGTGKKGFLETLQEAQLLSAVAGIRGLLHQPSVQRTVPSGDLDVVRHFINRPEDFVGGHAGALSAVQIQNNPFGDYAPQSTQVQGILKGMFDSFSADLEKSNGEESQKQKSFEELMETKRKELATLQLTLEKQTLDSADKTKLLAETKTSLDDTKAQLAADEALFSDTRESCAAKASEWSERTRLRTEELAGIDKAVAILSTPEAKATFANSSATFLQIRAVENDPARTEAYNRLRTIATQYHNVGLARIAAAVKTNGHFDKVIDAIDKMIATLRKEEVEDIAHRDLCQQTTNKNTNDMEDINHDLTRLLQDRSRLVGEANAVQKKLETFQENLDQTKASMKEMQRLRTQENQNFRKALQDDADAVALLEQAILAMAKFYRANSALVQLHVPMVAAPAPVYTHNPDKAPETVWSGADYKGRKEESGGVLAILGMIKEDIEMQMKSSRADEASAQKNYETDRQAVLDSLRAQEATLRVAEKEQADINAKIAMYQRLKEQKGSDLKAESDLQAALANDCAWVATHFKSRREKRKNELAGLVDAKNYLAGVASGTADDTLMEPILSAN